LAELRDTFREVRKFRIAFTFLVAYWLYIDGVDTVIRMAVDYGMSIGLASRDLIAALLITQFVGFPAAIVFGRLGERMGAKRAIFAAIAVYVGVTAWAALMDSAREFYALAAVIGLVQGGIQALSRSLYARLIPEDRASEFFGFYNMLGKFAAIIGPVLVGSVSLMTGSPRASILAILVLFVAGAVLLARVDVQRGTELARQASRNSARPASS
jgi:UMF1 family MFS transporter